MNDREAIFSLHRQWIAFEKSDDPLGVLKLCHDDVVWLIPGTGALRGKPAIREWLEQQSLMTIEQIEFPQIEVEVSGTLAVKRAEFITTIKNPENSEILEFQGSHLWTMIKDSVKGCWQVSNVSWAITN
jgi:ketosteroid isomerase-like protein